MTWLGHAAALCTVVALIAVGLIIARHQPRNPIGWLFLAMPVLVLAFSLCQYVVTLTFHHHRWLAITSGLLTQVFYYCFLFSAPLILLFFPDGNLPSPRWRWVLRAYLALATCVPAVVVVSVLIRASRAQLRFDASGNLTTGPGPLALAVLVALLLACLALAVSWVIRRVLGYRRATGAVRQQFKWLAVGAVCLLAALVISFITPSGQSAKATLYVVATDILGGIFPLTVGIAILKYRLYDIDRIISRTLSYLLVTATLVGVYIGVVALTTRALPFSSPLGVALSTLVAVALFAPLRRRVQRLVDRRFNRVRYDADVTVAAFAATLRTAVTLDTVCQDFLDAVTHAVEPSHIALWVPTSNPDS